MRRRNEQLLIYLISLAMFESELIIITDFVNFLHYWIVSYNWSSLILLMFMGINVENNHHWSCYYSSLASIWIKLSPLISLVNFRGCVSVKLPSLIKFGSRNGLGSHSRIRPYVRPNTPNRNNNNNNNNSEHL